MPLRAPAPRRTATKRHIFSGDLADLLDEVKRLTKAKKLHVLRAADMDVPSVAVMVGDLGAFLDQAGELGRGVVYLSPDELGVMLEEQIDVVDELRETIPPGDAPDEKQAAEEMTESLLRLQEVQNAHGGPAFRLGYLREGVMHEVILEDDLAAPGAALVDLTLRGELHDHDHDHEPGFVPGR